MKFFCIGFVLLAFSTSSFAQWTLGTGSTYYSTNYFNIGNNSASTAALSINPSFTGGSSPATSLIIGNLTTTLPNTAGSYLYPFEIHHSNAGGHSGKLQFATYRRIVGPTGSEWSGTSYRIQYMYDATGAQGQNAFVEIGQSDPANSGNGFISLGTNGADRLSIGGNGNIGIGTTSPIYHSSAYTSVTVNNATNGGIIDLAQAGVIRGAISGDGNGLNLLANTGSGIHVYTNGSTEAISVLSNGNVGVGQVVPLVKLHVNGAILSGAAPGNIDPAATGGNLSYLAGTGLTLIGYNRSAGGGEADFISNQGPGSIGGFAFYNYGNSTSTNTTTTELMAVRGSGQVLIGVSDYNTNKLGTNKLAVGGGVIAEAITVKLQTAPWPDNVFRPNYKLMPLNEIQSFVDKNHHLPEIPSEAEVQKDGQNLGEMNRLLLKKVEELTLYLIEKDKQDQKHEDSLKLQQLQILKLQTELYKLNSKIKIYQKK